MTEQEHSTLVYLLDAIDTAPKKAGRLVALAEKTNASEQYRSLLCRFKCTEDPLVVSRKIRAEIR